MTAYRITRKVKPMHAKAETYHLKDRPHIVSAQSAGFKPRKPKCHGPASDCVVTRADGTTYTIKAGKTKRQARKTAKVAAFAVQSRNLDLLKLCGNIGNVE